jgi:phosphopantothenoylcysteine decarboxylase/phosphopantothenate--cysteine ligase
MTANPDIAGGTATIRKPGSVAVGFALETADLIENAARKLERKAFDLVVANDATEEGAGFEGVTNRVTILSADGEPEALALMSKDEVAEEILDRVATRLESGG